MNGFAFYLSFFVFQPQDIITLLDASFIDGTIYCKFERDPVTIIRDKEFDLIKNKYYLMLALGTAVLRNYFHILRIQTKLLPKISHSWIGRNARYQSYSIH